MKLVIWALGLAALGAAAYTFWKWRSRWRAHKRASEERLASFVAQARPAQPKTEPPKPLAPQERLLLDAAAKAGEAGEPALSIQLYARLLSRYPDSACGAQARAAVEAQKQKLARP